MKLIDLGANLVPLFGISMSEVTELLRALKEGSEHFDPAKLEVGERRLAAQAGAELTPAVVAARPGPGGGLDADPFRAAFLVIAIMLGKRRREVALETWTTWHLVQAGSELSGWGDDWQAKVKLCPLTRSPLFGDAFKIVLADIRLAAKVDEIRIGDGFAEITFGQGRVSRFEEAGQARPHLSREACIDRFAVQSIAMLLQR